MSTSEKFYTRLTRLFRSGPAIQRKIKGTDSRNLYSNQLIQGNYGYKATAPFGFGRENSPFSVLGSYGVLDRISRYSEFEEMCYSPEIAAALDIYADETVGGDERGKSFHIYSKNAEVKNALDDLFYDIINVEFNLRVWVRNMIKYGDFFLFNEVAPDMGIIAVSPIPVNELEREEGFDLQDPYAIRFRWLTRGNKYLENWQVVHLRILNNDLFLPYGTSILEPARRTFRQLMLLEDAMLVYRVVRSPERRAFFIDVGNIPPTDVENYMEAAKATLRSQSVMDKRHGREDMRLNAMSVLDDFFIPVRGQQTGTRIETLGGASHATDIEDVEYIQKKLFAALKVPKPYLNFDENLSSKASLSQMDVRFSRTISSMQKIVLSELNKLAMIHLYAKGFDLEDLIDFELRLSNPSSIAMQQKLELWASKFDIAGSAKETKLVDERWVQRNILELGEGEIGEIEKGLLKDKLRTVEIDNAEPEPPPENTPAKTTDLFNPANYLVPGQDVAKAPQQTQDSNTSFIFGDPSNENMDDSIAQLDLSKQKRIDADGNPYIVNFDSEDKSSPIKATPFMTRNKRDRTRRVGQRGRENLAMPDHNAMLSNKNKYNRDINGTKTEKFDPMANYDDDEMLLEDEEIDNRILLEPNINRDMRSMLEKMKSKLNIVDKSISGGLLKEAIEDELVIEIEEDKLLNDGLLLEVVENKNDQEEAIEEKTLQDIFKSNND